MNYSIRQFKEIISYFFYLGRQNKLGEMERTNERIISLYQDVEINWETWMNGWMNVLNNEIMNECVRQL